MVLRLCSVGRVGAHRSTAAPGGRLTELRQDVAKYDTTSVDVREASDA